VINYNDFFKLNYLKIKTVPIFFTLFFVIVLYYFYQPLWETNDDVGMSMIAHGYGVAALSSPNLVFSNVIWGYLTQSIPIVNGILGYSIATIATLLVIGCMLIYGMLRFDIGYFNSVLIFLLIMLRPLIFPQFTINAGLITVISIIFLKLYEIRNIKSLLLASCFLFYVGYLIRSEECLLVLFISLPFLNWRILLKQSFLYRVFLALFILVVLSSFINYQAYQGPDWIEFKETGKVLGQLVDFGGSVLLSQHPEIYEKYSYSLNDLNLIGSWFFVDPKIIQTKTLQSMLSILGPIAMQENTLQNIWISIKAVFDPNLLPHTVGTLLLITLNRNRSLLFCFILYFISVSSLGLLGRPGIIRVYLPIISFLFIASFITTYNSSRMSKYFSTFILLLTMCWNSSNIIKAHDELNLNRNLIQTSLTEFTTKNFVNWGGSFPLELVYPVLFTNPDILSFKIYSLGGLTFAPFTNTYVAYKNGSALPSLIVNNGIDIIASQEHFKMLAIYCMERLHGRLHEISVTQYGSIILSRQRCEIIHK